MTLLLLMSLFLAVFLNIFIIWKGCLCDTKWKIINLLFILGIEFALIIVFHYWYFGYINLFWTVICICNKWTDYHIIDELMKINGISNVSIVDSNGDITV